MSSPRPTCVRCGAAIGTGGLLFARRFLASVPERRCVDVAACHARIEAQGQLTLKVSR